MLTKKNSFNRGKVVEVSSSILSADFANLGKSVEMLTDAGVDYIHVDVMDGNFVPNITIGPVVVSAIKKYTTIPFDVHLMINSPGNYIEAFVDAGADMITIHAESDIHLDRIIQKIKSYKKSAGLSLVPTSHYNILEYIIFELDLVLIMTVNPGFGGQQFITSQLDKISCVRNLIEKYSLKTKIAVDGGVNIKNAKSVIEAGADILVVGSAIFNANNMLDYVQQLKSSF
ncbi:ribulose-phosphate 3-epimerase [Ehrlichia chaffeensis str. Heartland]|uniref:Ribulose-phosphate 3-epimerase n=1 Tax=Ehrlichia chaffeensis (strain ATCC CRL-10679 / Arkansas) TaxID=205920 RepID=Q2GI21_EHRCR|nr:ribulose-phosphate 3-epimerase [Ehrlichia chaffeensis]ABD45303.1 ribulose-phosphate 3-epimerase [Ehrlichia chaffeensis str. Arkansas]AHX04106.1 ribulose-phosphate 3-epimerase [Ehrlichia chaffeensis str. Heartland]AHX06042.1 ribulose-phosphate 3-epimerase [Ehrlichia chaffeensis str. Jax]AHX07032.1 ribulose-phosphate 3-epimerase [Ehrlichia chaffeensis str. Liberty]AHX07217.1 ribulose-phosphate 3-epimerase [Ehrlichia chaffeensis str. Osceola]